MIGRFISISAMTRPILVSIRPIRWMLYTYFKEMPGKVRGHVLWGEIIYVLTPMALPGIASTMLLNIILANEAFWTIVLTTTKAAPLSAFIASFCAPQGLFYAKLSAASAMAMLPDPDPWLVQPEATRPRPDLWRGEVR